MFVTAMEVFCKMLAMGVAGIMIGLWIAFCGRKDDDFSKYFHEIFQKHLLFVLFCVIIIIQGK